MQNEAAGLREIRAIEVKIEVTDLKTGRTFHRTLPIDYHETANILRLGGENSQGNPSELVFYTAEGQQRLLDMIGHGPDEDPCGTHK